MDTNSINNTILKVLYLTIILSVIFKNTEKLIPQIPNIIPSISNINESISKNINIPPISTTFYNKFCNSLYKYLVIFCLAFVISSIVFYSTYKIIQFVKNINNSDNSSNSEEFENIYDNNIIRNINVKIKKKENENENENQNENEN